MNRQQIPAYRTDMKTQVDTRLAEDAARKPVAPTADGADSHANVAEYDGLFIGICELMLSLLRDDG